MCAWHPYHTTSYHLQLDLFSRVIPQDKEDLWAQDGLFPPTQGRSDVFTMKKVYYITEDISPFFHHFWLSKLGHTALLLTCNLTIHVNNPTEFALTDYWKWKTPGNKTKSWDTFCKWTLNKTLYTVRLSTSNCLGFCIKYYYCIKTVVFESKSGFHQLYLKLYLNIYMDLQLEYSHHPTLPMLHQNMFLWLPWWLI